jgi:hypothetical protein
MQFHSDLREIRWVRFSHACWSSGSPFEDHLSYSLTGSPRNCLLVVLRQNVDHSAIRMTHAIYAPATDGMQDSATDAPEEAFLDPAVDTPSTKGSGNTVGAPYFSAICRTLRSGGTRIRTGDTMIFRPGSHN